MTVTGLFQSSPGVGSTGQLAWRLLDQFGNVVPTVAPIPVQPDWDGRIATPLTANDTISPPGSSWRLAGVIDGSPYSQAYVILSSYGSRVDLAQLTSIATVWYLDQFSGTDDQKLAQALTGWATSATGGVIQLPPRTCTFLNQWTTSYTGDTTTKYLAIKGAGFAANGRWKPPTALTIVEHDYNGSGAAKADFHHVGTVDMSGFLMQDTSGGTTPFVLCTNTQPQIHDIGFRGSKLGTACNQDAILLGGTGTVIGDTDTAPFQGYGGTVARVFFDGIRHCVAGQTYCNNIAIEDNTVSSSCGSAAANDAPFTLTGIASSACVGNIIQRNTVEVSNYAYLAALTAYAQNNVLGPNGAYDPTATTLGVYYFATSSYWNAVEDGYRADTIPLVVEDASCANTTTYRTSHQSQVGVLAAPVLAQGGLFAFSDSGVGGNPLQTLSSRGDTAYLRMTTGPLPQIDLMAVANVSFTDGVTNSTTTFTSATAAFTTADLGAVLYSPGNIPAFTRILKIVNATTVRLSQAATTTASGLTFYMQRASGAQTLMASWSRAHYISQGSAPSPAAGAAAGSGASASLVGNDTAGTITLSTGTGTTAGQVLSMGAATSYTTQPRVVLFPRNAAAAAQAANLYNTGSTSNAILLQAIAALPISTTFIWDYLAVQ